MTRDLTAYRAPRPPAPAEFPRGQVSDLFPLTAVPEAITARTVFTAYTIAQKTPTNPYAPPLHVAVCACGDTWRADSEAMLRRTLGAHSCVDERGRPVELVPINDVPDDGLLDRVLSGLRSLP